MERPSKYAIVLAPNYEFVVIRLFEGEVDVVPEYESIATCTSSSRAREIVFALTACPPETP